MLEMKSLFVFTEVLFQGKKWHFLKKKNTGGFADSSEESPDSPAGWSSSHPLLSRLDAALSTQELHSWPCGKPQM